MKFIPTICLIIISNTIGLAQERKKEVLLIGAMHQVPKMMKNSYTPLLKKAKEYRPEAIYVESSMPNDNKSWEYLKDGYSETNKKFYKLSDSLKTNFQFDESAFTTISKKPLDRLTNDELNLLIISFAYLRDSHNFHYYKYIRRYGINGSKKPLRIENYDLNAKLALHLGHKKLYATDDQQTNDLFHTHWRKCQKLGLTKKEKKIERKMTRKFILPSLFGRYGIRTNRPEVLDYLHQSSSLRLSFQEDTDCQKATHYWDERNRRIVKNLGTQILEKYHANSVLVIGASHIVGVKAELQKQFPDIKVVLFDELD